MKRFIILLGYCLFSWFFCTFSLARAVPPALGEEGTPLFSFGLFTDCQYCDCSTNGLREYSLAPQKLRECVAAFNERPLRFVINLGDFINSGLSSFDTITSIMQNLRHPFYFVYGNHDFFRSEPEDRMVLQHWGLQKRYYSFVQSGWRFIILDSNDISLYTSVPGSAQYQKTLQYIEDTKKLGGNSQTSNGGMGEVQIKWLKAELDVAQKKGERVIVCNHMPVYAPELLHKLWNDQQVLKVLEASPQLVAYFCGHDHEGHYFYYKNIHFLNFIGMVDTQENAYSVIHVYDDRIEVEGFAREPSRTLPFVVR